MFNVAIPVEHYRRVMEQKRGFRSIVYIVYLVYLGMSAGAQNGIDQDIQIGVID